MATILSADGCVETGAPSPSNDCCPVGLGRIDFCAMACSFVELLPSGPMWDKPKAEALSYYQNNRGMNPCEPACAPDEFECQTLVAYAVYLAKVLLDLLQNAVWPTLRESDPSTAVTTIDSWLERLAWQDCYNTACRSLSLGQLTPYEIMGECGPVFCPVSTPVALECAVKRAIVQALSRANMGGIRNLCWINWVIAPLGAKIEGSNVPPCDADYPGKPMCYGQEFLISPTASTLPACPEDTTPVATGKDQGAVPAMITLTTCDRPAGMPDEIWPGLIAAECIVRSLFPNHLAKRIRRSC